MVIEIKVKTESKSFTSIRRVDGLTTREIEAEVAKSINRNFPIGSVVSSSWKFV